MESFITSVSILFLLLSLYFGKKYYAGPSCKIKKDLQQKIVLITGGNVGIGFEIIRYLASLGATIVIASFEKESSLEAIKRLKLETNNQQIHFMYVNLASFDSIKNFAKAFQESFQRLDFLIDNAGIITAKRSLSHDGLEQTMAVNYFGHFYLTLLLVHLLEKSKPSRIIITTSITHRRTSMNWDDLCFEKGFFGLKAYGQSKLALLMFSKELNRRIEERGIKVVSVHPGVARTRIMNDYFLPIWARIIMTIAAPFYYFFTKSPVEGAQTALHCCLLEDRELVGGGYYADCRLSQPSKEACDQSKQQKLWDETEKIISKKGFKVPLL